MARIFDKIPNFKLPKFKMRDIDDIEELKINYTLETIAELKAKLKAEEEGPHGYKETDYQTIKEVFSESIEKFADRPFIYEKFNRKEGFKGITYGQFGEDVKNLGEGLSKAFKLKGEKIMIIGETTYPWYVSYMAMLCGVGIAVPTDKELPDNELENLVKRSDAAAIIYSPKKKDQIKKVANKCPGVKYFIEMKSDHKLEGRFVGMDFVMQEGKFLREMGDTTFVDTEIDPEAFAVLLFTSGTTSAAKVVSVL